MNLKNYLTPARVKAYATTPKKALAISKKHWWQNTQLTPKQLVKMYRWTTEDNMCGLCVYHRRNCACCPLGQEVMCWLNTSLYQLAFNAEGIYHLNKTEANYLAFIEAAKNMHKCLCELEKEQ